MKKLVLFLCIFSISFYAYADSSVQPDVLLDNNVVQLSRKIESLAAQIASLERESRFQDERIRRLDRQVTDLKRRRS